MSGIKVYMMLRERGGYFSPPAERQASDNVSDKLQAQGYPRLPEDYAEFLGRANGAQSSIGLILYGTRPQDMAAGEQAPDILEATRRDGGDNGVILGRSPGNMLLLFSGADKGYLMMDGGSRDALYSFDSLEAMVGDWLSRKKPKRVAGMKPPDPFCS